MPWLRRDVIASELDTYASSDGELRIRPRRIRSRAQYVRACRALARSEGRDLAHVAREVIAAGYRRIPPREWVYGEGLRPRTLDDFRAWLQRVDNTRRADATDAVAVWLSPHRDEIVRLLPPEWWRQALDRARWRVSIRRARALSQLARVVEAPPVHPLSSRTARRLVEVCDAGTLRVAASLGVLAHLESCCDLQRRLGGRSQQLLRLAERSSAIARADTTVLEACDQVLRRLPRCDDAKWVVREHEALARLVAVAGVDRAIAIVRAAGRTAISPLVYKCLAADPSMTLASVLATLSVLRAEDYAHSFASRRDWVHWLYVPSCDPVVAGNDVLVVATEIAVARAGRAVVIPATGELTLEQRVGIARKLEQLRVAQSVWQCPDRPGLLILLDGRPLTPAYPHVHVHAAARIVLGHSPVEISEHMLTRREAHEWLLAGAHEHPLRWLVRDVPRVAWTPASPVLARWYTTLHQRGVWQRRVLRDTYGHVPVLDVVERITERDLPRGERTSLDAALEAYRARLIRELAGDRDPDEQLCELPAWTRRLPRGVRVLATVEDLVREHEEQHHCADTYVPRVRDGNCLLLSITAADGSRSTLQANRDGLGRWSTGQHRAAWNKDPSDACVRVAAQIERMLEEVHHDGTTHQ